MKKLKIAVLIARSDMFPSLGLDLLNGLKLSMKKKYDSASMPQFLIENIGVAADELILRGAEKMILQEEVDGVVAFCGIAKLASLQRLVDGYKKPLIHIDLGGNILKQTHISSYVLHHTLNLWQSCYTAGLYAANSLGKNACMAASFYDGGYQLTQSFANGFNQNNGVVTDFFVAAQDYKTETFETLRSILSSSKPEVLFLLFSYKEAVKVFEVLADFDLSNTKIVASPIMTDPAFNTSNYNVENVYSVASWSFDDTSDSMIHFLNSFKTAYNEAPSVFGLLGYEIGDTILACITNDGRWFSKMKEHLEGVKIASPRGWLHYNEFNESQVDSFKLRKFQFDEKRYRNKIIKDLNIEYSIFKQHEFSEQPYTGWQNPYICT